jgi:hypothetical protein
MAPAIKHNLEALYALLEVHISGPIPAHHRRGDTTVNDTDTPKEGLLDRMRKAEDRREAQRQALAERNAKRCALIRAATLVPLARSTTAQFRVDPPVDTDFGDPDGWTYRVTEVRARVTHYIGDDHGEPHQEVACFVDRLTAKGEPSQNVDPHWLALPTELAAELLGRAMVA